MEQFFHMGGHAGYVWPAYIAVALVMVGLWVASKRFQRTSAEKLTALDVKQRRSKSKPVHET